MLKTKLGGCLEVLTYHYTEVAHVDVLLHNTAQAPLQREKGLSDASSDLMRTHTGRSQALVLRKFFFKRFPSSTSLQLLNVVGSSKIKK